MTERWCPQCGSSPVIARNGWERCGVCQWIHVRMRAQGLGDLYAEDGVPWGALLSRHARGDPAYEPPAPK
jgi:hypothetical protein